MKKFARILFISAFVLMAGSCLSDPVAPNNDPSIPMVSYDEESLTRRSVTLQGTLSGQLSNVIEYGFELAEGSLESDYILCFKNPPKDGNSFTYTAEIQHDVSYEFRAYVSNGQEKKYSRIGHFKAPNTSKATLSEVELKGHLLSANIEDSGGRTITDVGFVYAKVNDPKTIKKSQKYSARWNADSTGFSLDMSAFAFGETYYFLAYATDSEDDNGYSHEPLKVVFDDSFLVDIEDEHFNAYLINNFDTNNDRKLSYGELAAIKAIDVRTDEILSIMEINWMPNLEKLSCCGSRVGSGKLKDSIDVSKNTLLTTLRCDNNQIKTLDLSNTPIIDTLSISGNLFDQIDISQYSRMTYLDCRNNPVDTIYLLANQRVNILKEKETNLFYLLTGFSILPNSLSMRMNETISLEVLLSPEDAVEEARQVLWQSTDTQIAVVSEDGVVSGCGDGNCSIVATCWGWTDTCVITICPVPTDSISLNQILCQIPLRESRSLIATVFPEDATDKTIKWSSSDESVATVSQEGVITAVSVGTCYVTAACGEKKAVCEVMAVIPVSEVLFDQKTKEVYVEEKIPLNATIIPDNATIKRLDWTSSDSSVAVVDSTGIVTPVGKGTCTITATPLFGKAAMFECVVVSEAPFFADAVFQDYIYTNFDTNRDGFLSRTEAMAIISIVVCTDNIESMDEIRYFQNLETLRCYGNGPSGWSGKYVGYGKLTSLDLSNNTKLRYLTCSKNNLISLDLSKNLQLKGVDCGYNQLISINYSSLDGLEYLYCRENLLETLDVSRCPNLRSLDCNSNKIVEMDFSNNEYLEFLDCSWNGLSVLEVAKNKNLKRLGCSGNNLTELNVSHNISLEELFCYFNQLHSLDVTQNKLLKILQCYTNSISSLVLSSNTQLQELSCNDNPLSSLDISNNTKLQKLSCANNQLSELKVTNQVELQELYCERNQLGSIDLSQNPKLKILYCGDNLLTELQIDHLSDLNALGCENNKLSTLDLSNCTKLKRLICRGNENMAFITMWTGFSPDELDYYEIGNSGFRVTTAEDDETEIEIEDPAFKEYLLHTYDLNGNGKLSVKEASHILLIDVCTDNITSLKGIEYFVNLRNLSCYGSLGIDPVSGLVYYLGSLSTLDISKNTLLTSINCPGNKLTTLDVSNNTDLETLFCSSNQLTELDVSKNTSLTTLGCVGNKIITLDVSKNTALIALHCDRNLLSKLDVSKCTALVWLYCSDNQLVSLDVSKNVSLRFLDCYGNQLTNLDVSKNVSLQSLSCGSNQLTSLDVSHNAALTYLSCRSNQLLTEIWLKTGQTIAEFYYDTSITTIIYKE